VSESTVDKSVLRVQYGDDQRLSARQRLWQTAADLVGRVLDLSGIGPADAVLDVGCGNGRYLQRLRLRGHTGPLLGLDYSAGMAAVAGDHAPTAVADAQALPVGDGRVRVVLCAHMLYHVPDPARAIGELRRVLRPDGSAVVVTNGPNHTGEPAAILTQALLEVTGAPGEIDTVGRRFPPDLGEALMVEVFDRVETYQVGGPVTVPSPEVVGDYFESLPPESAGLTQSPLWTDVLRRARELVAEHVDRHGPFIVTSDTTVLIGRISTG
jgi:SAM-dependent methyltransferase